MKNVSFLRTDSRIIHVFEPILFKGFEIFLKEVKRDFISRGEHSKIGIKVNVSGFVKMKCTQKTK